MHQTVFFVAVATEPVFSLRNVKRMMGHLAKCIELVKSQVCRHQDHAVLLNQLGEVGEEQMLLA